MLLFYRICVVFYVFITTAEEVYSYCNKTDHPHNCAYDVYCYDDYYHSRNDDDNIYNFPDYLDREVYDADDSPCDLIYYNLGYTRPFYPIHLTYKRTLSTPQDIPIDEIHNIKNLITQLDFSKNNYQYIPEIIELNNLALLNFSNNLITIAKLSNTKEFRRLSEIDLSHNKIIDITYEPGEIYGTLKKIDLSYNYLTSIREAVFDPFDELETLDLSHNYIEMLSPITFEGMKQLKHLNISFNKISDINTSLLRFVDLKLLDLSNNNIKTIKATDFGKLTGLEILDLNSNLISVIEQQSFDNMRNLQNLYLNKNKLRDVDKEILKNLTALKIFDLSENSFSKIPKNMFKNKTVHWFSIKNNLLEGALERGMFEGLAAPQLDLSCQHLDSVEDYAFSGLINLYELLLNNNNISILSIKSFKALDNLNKLDLSFNKIQSIDFIKDDLYHLFSLSLRNNNLTVIKQENFRGLNSLQFLDLSDNKITQVETNSFISLKELINFQISNNPLSGTLEGNTFNGLSYLPSLDISCSSLSFVKNGSFVGMAQLKNLNASHSKINALEYNIFVLTGAIEIIDLSFNELKDFNINTTELAKLNTLYLNNNSIKKLDSSSFKGILNLSELGLSYRRPRRTKWQSQNHNFSGKIKNRFSLIADDSLNSIVSE